MRTLGYMPTEMELIEVSQHVKMRSQCLTPHLWGWGGQEPPALQAQPSPSPAVQGNRHRRREVLPGVHWESGRGDGGAREVAVSRAV